MKVPFIDLRRHEVGFLEAVRAKFEDLVERAEFIGGSEVEALERRLASYTSVKHAVTCANGTDAIQLALRALGVGAGDVVLVPDVTFWATFEAVVNVGARPATIAADYRDGGVDFDAFRAAVHDLRPKAAVIAHLYGWASGALAEIRSFCKAEGVTLVEDGAQCFGTKFLSSSIYSGAHVSTMSFYPAKVFGGAGDGGAVLTDDASLAEKVRQLANHGRIAHYGYGDVGWNSRLDSLQAAYLNVSFDYLEPRLASRRASAEYYRRMLPQIGVNVMKLPEVFHENGYCNVCLINGNEKKRVVEEALKREGIGFGNIYPGVLSQQTGAARYLAAHVGGDEGVRLCRSVLNLPLFPHMTDAELGRVVEVVQSAVEGRG